MQLVSVKKLLFFVVLLKQKYYHLFKLAILQHGN